jgi:hypothetical protein
MKPFSAPLLEDSLKGPALLGVAIAGCSAGFLLFGYDQGIASKFMKTANGYMSTFPLTEPLQMPSRNPRISPGSSHL